MWSVLGIFTDRRLFEGFLIYLHVGLLAIPSSMHKLAVHTTRACTDTTCFPPCTHFLEACLRPDALRLPIQLR